MSEQEGHKGELSPNVLAAAASGGTAVCTLTDVCDWDQKQALVAATEKAYGVVDILPGPHMGGIDDFPGQPLLLYEMAPAFFAAAAANEAEREVPEAALVDVRMIGASGCVFMAGRSDDLIRARKRSTQTLAAIKPG